MKGTVLVVRSLALQQRDLHLQLSETRLDARRAISTRIARGAA
jgi:hypothetical protein